MKCGTHSAADTTVESRQHSTHSLALFKNRTVRSMVFSSPYTTSVFSSLEGPLVPMLLSLFGILVSGMAPSSKAVQIGGRLSLCFGQMVLSLILHPTSASTITTIFVLLPSGVLKH